MKKQKVLVCKSCGRVWEYDEADAHRECPRCLKKVVVEYR